ncbi:hypothetical protein F442_08553 [Phytophthora nicotianae P10297]|uniref:Uncharacterized protein n=2 Tax=Phytophthora nicotianae TaxID=4792 RepID=W2PC77_PHYN3|nr:hypothetical protein PPTG_20046 [Phytophthora nicotianae INRA-310]ETM97803.1 hypothetical protein PPTG_20046 [Phytophthora nicotianae INRA-310]ETP44940.1 hypothetical protein F442_08553 [Phytophthora nicotianae P10297]
MVSLGEEELMRYLAQIDLDALRLEPSPHPVRLPLPSAHRLLSNFQIATLKTEMMSVASTAEKKMCPTNLSESTSKKKLFKTQKQLPAIVKYTKHCRIIQPALKAICSLLVRRACIIQDNSLEADFEEVVDHDEYSTESGVVADYQTAAGVEKTSDDDLCEPASDTEGKANRVTRTDGPRAFVVFESDAENDNRDWDDDNQSVESVDESIPIPPELHYDNEMISAIGD